MLGTWDNEFEISIRYRHETCFTRAIKEVVGYGMKIDKGGQHSDGTCNVNLIQKKDCNDRKEMGN